MTGSATTRPLGRRSKLPFGLGQLWLPRRRPASVDKVICASGLTTSKRLLNALALLAPVAWRLLLLRHLARHQPERPARDALTASHVAVLRAVSKAPLPQKLSASDALLAIARLGGHIRANGEPGWLVLARGFRDLLLLERGWSARPRERSDQS